LSGHRAALFSEALGFAIAAAVTIFAFVAFIATTARSLSRADRVRKASERHLAAQNVTTCVLVESATLAEAMPRVLEAVCKSLDWVMGVHWSVDSQAHVLRCAETHVAPPRPSQQMAEVNRRVTFPHGVGLPGRVWSTGRAAWIADVVHDPNFPRAAAAAKDGLHGAFGFPIIGPGGFLGVMEFFSTEIREQNAAVLALFEGIGGQVGQFIERKRAEAELERAKVAAEAATQAKSDFLANARNPDADERDHRYVRSPDDQPARAPAARDGRDHSHERSASADDHQSNPRLFQNRIWEARTRAGAVRSR
jgi:GAF domain-containing protein